jgi:TRAP-type mannitol/chloroaromatic compound transport system permease small subunit
MKKLTQQCESGFRRVAHLASLLMILIMGLISWEVVSRYLLNSPTSYVWPICKQLFGAYVLIAGPLTLLDGGHLRIEIFHERFSPRLKNLISILSGIAVAVFAGVLTWQGARMGQEAFQAREVATGVFKLALWPLKLFIPVGALLMLLAGVVYYFVRREKVE